jgi:hypothetical protein
MTRVYVADGKSKEPSALRLLLLDLMMEVVGDAASIRTGFPCATSGIKKRSQQITDGIDLTTARLHYIQSR